MRREPAKRYPERRAAAVTSDVILTNTVNRGSEGCYWWIEDVAGGVLVQVNESWRKTIERVSRRLRHQRTVGLNALQYPLWTGRQGIE